MAKTHNGGQLLVQCLLNLGASKAFGVPGESYLPVLDALYDVQGELEFIVCRNEGGAAFMSVAYAKLCASPGICFVTRGPGATNASIGVHTARQDSTPMLLFVGQVSTHMKYREAFQEIDYSAWGGSIAKWVVEINHVERIPELISRAWSTALSGRQGPVIIVLPENVLSAITGVPACLPVHISEPAPDQMMLDRARTMIGAAQRPLILAGGRGWNVSGRKALQDFASRNHLPLAVAFRFQDLVDHHGPCYVGNAGVGMTPQLKATIKSADLIIAIGVRFGEMSTAGYTLWEIPNPQTPLIHSHSADSELGKVVAAQCPIHAGPNLMAQALASLELNLDSARSAKSTKWLKRAREGYFQALEVPSQPGAVDMGQIMQILQQGLPDDAVLSNGAGNFAIWLNQYFRFGARQRLLAPQSGAMGFGLPAAIAAKALNKGATVVCFAGDGDFQMNCQELGTAMQYGIQPIVLIINNGSYGTIRMHQERHFPGRVSGTQLQNPDFEQLAKAYGFETATITKTTQFAPAFERALASPAGAIIDIQVDAEGLTPRQTLSEIREQASKLKKRNQS